MIGTTDLSQLPGRANPIYLEGKVLPVSAEQARVLQLKDSEVIQALVRQGGMGDLELLLRGRAMPLPNLPLNWLPGQSVSLRVRTSASGALALVPLADDAPAAPAQSLPNFFSRIGNLLFRPPGLAELAQVLQPGQLDKLLQTAGRTDLQAQWRGMQLSMAQLNPQALGQAMSAALGSEVWLARGQLPPVEDPKQLLRKLIAALSRGDAADGEEGEGTLEGLGALRRAVDDLEAAQVQAVQAQAQRELLFSCVLPFVDAEPVELQFRRAPRQGGESPPLTVNVHSRNRELGEVWLKTQLHGLDRVDLTMWALKEDVASQARLRSAELGAQLAEAGLAMQSFQVVHGPRLDQQPDWKPSGRGMVVDISA